MLGIWGENCVNPEYDALRKKYPDLGSSLNYLKREASIQVDTSVVGTPIFDIDAGKVVYVPVAQPE